MLKRQMDLPMTGSDPHRRPGRDRRSAFQESRAVFSFVLLSRDPSRVRQIKDRLRSTARLALVGASTEVSRARQVLRASGASGLVIDAWESDAATIRAAKMLKLSFPNLAILLVLSQTRAEGITQALAAGAHGCILRESGCRGLIKALRELREGHCPISPALLQSLVHHLHCFGRSPPVCADLSPRELEVLSELAAGHLYKEIANRLHISIDTVRHHVRRIYSKLDVRSRAQAVAKLRESEPMLR